MGNRIYGCDDCLAVCPWNKFAKLGQETKLKARDDLNAPALSELAQLGEDNFRQKFSGSPIKRIGWTRFLRNVLYAIGNSQDTSFIPIIQPYINADDPTIFDAANWAKAQIENSK